MKSYINICCNISRNFPPPVLKGETEDFKSSFKTERENEENAATNIYITYHFPGF